MTDYNDAPGRFDLLRDLAAVVLIALGALVVLGVVVIAAFQTSLLLGIGVVGLSILAAGVALGMSR